MSIRDQLHVNHSMRGTAIVVFVGLSAIAKPQHVNDQPVNERKCFAMLTPPLFGALSNVENSAVLCWNRGRSETTMLLISGSWRKMADSSSRVGFIAKLQRVWTDPVFDTSGTMMGSFPVSGKPGSIFNIQHDIKIQHDEDRDSFKTSLVQWSRLVFEIEARLVPGLSVAVWAWKWGSRVECMYATSESGRRNIRRSVSRKDEVRGVECAWAIFPHPPYLPICR